jgi:hypothetical protein
VTREPQDGEAGRYTLRQAVSECAARLAFVMVVDAFLCVCLAALSWPVAANAVVTGLLGPVGCTVAIVGRWRYFRRSAR